MHNVACYGDRIYTVDLDQRGTVYKEDILHHAFHIKITAVLERLKEIPVFRSDNEQCRIMQPDYRSCIM